jgi:hypothetical protein
MNNNKKIFIKSTRYKIRAKPSTMFKDFMDEVRNFYIICYSLKKFKQCMQVVLIEQYTWVVRKEKWGKLGKVTRSVTQHLSKQLKKALR